MKTLGNNSGFRQRGMTLIELMIAMTIGIFLVGGAMAVFVTASTTRDTNDEIARMQENVRYALNTIKPDLRQAGYWGLTKELGTITGYAGSTTQLVSMSNDCADRWYIDLINEVAAFNDTNPWAATCLPAAEYAPNTDILVVRHTATNVAAALTSGLMYIRSDANHGALFEGSAPPAGTFSGLVEDHQLQTHAYYIRPYTFTPGDGIPSLRRLIVSDTTAADPIIDQEIIPGIEDLQVQFGVDTDADGSINQYLHPDNVIAGMDVLAVRVWLMARAEDAEAGFINAATYTYASKSVTPNDGFRRMLVTSTIELRNLQPNTL